MSFIFIPDEMMLEEAPNEEGMYKFTPSGICPSRIVIDLDGDVVRYVSFTGGCSGNLRAISKIVKGKTIDEVTAMFEGIRCAEKTTSCVDQLVHGLWEAKAAQ